MFCVSYWPWIVVQFQESNVLFIMSDLQCHFWELWRFVFFFLYIPINWVVNFSGGFSNGTRFYVYINEFCFSKFSTLYVSECICIYCACVLVIWDSVVFHCAWKPFPVEYLIIPLGIRFFSTIYFYLSSLSKRINIRLEENLIRFASRSVILKCIIWQELGAILLAVGHFTSLSHQRYILIH